MKFLKFIFSRFSLVFLTLLLNFVLFFVVILYFGNYYKWISLLLIFFSIIAFFSMLKKDEPPEFKVLWLIVFDVLPLFGIALYIFIGDSKPPKRQLKTMNNVKNQFDEKKKTFKKSKEKDNQSCFGTCDYLSKTTGLESYRGNVEFFDVGEKFFENLIEDLKCAKKFIFLEYFIIEKGEIWNQIFKILKEKTKSGVDVRVVYDDIGSAGKIGLGFSKKLKKEGIKCVQFNRFRPFISGIHNNRDHRKIAVIDGKIAYTGGCNIGDEYANIDSKFGHWKDSGVRITGLAVNNFTALFLQMYSASTKENVCVDEFIVSDVVDDGDCLIQTVATGPRPYSKESVGENNLMNMISSAKQKLFITTPYFIVDHALISALCVSAKKGVDVRIVVPHIPDKKVVFEMTRESYKQLLQAGVKVYEYTPGFIHSKQILVDDEVAFVGTINFDYRSLIHHFECGCVLCGGSVIGQIGEDFENLFNKSEEQQIEKLKNNPLKRLVNLLLIAFRPLF